jgi:hypothetical protein
VTPRAKTTRRANPDPKPIFAPLPFTSSALYMVIINEARGYHTYPGRDVVRTWVGVADFDTLVAAYKLDFEQRIDLKLLIMPARGQRIPYRLAPEQVRLIHPSDVDIEAGPGEFLGNSLISATSYLWRVIMNRAAGIVFEHLRERHQVEYNTELADWHARQTAPQT